MPFIAINKETGARVDITREAPDLIRRFKPGELVCQLCGGPMFPRSSHDRKDTRGQLYSVRAHFAHIASECDMTYSQHPESTEHRLGKMYVATEWIKQFGRYKDATTEYEVPIREVNRVVDVLATLPNGHRIAHEIQLAAITPRELEERTNDYARSGIDVFWHLGKSADTEPNRQFLRSAVDDFGLITFSEPTLRSENSYPVRQRVAAR